MQKFTLDSTIEPKNVDGTLLKTRKHDVVNGAYTYEFKSKDGNVFLTALAGKLQEVTYECRGIFPWSKKRKLKNLLTIYGVDKTWTKVFNNRSGCLYHNPEEVYYATWNRKSDFISFGVMFFREEMQRVVT